MQKADDLRKDPHRNEIVVGTIVYVFDEDGRVLLFKRKKPPFAGYWEAPGGKINFGERLVDAAVRELREETGIDADKSMLRFVEIMEHIIMPEYHRILAVYAVQVPNSVEIRATEHDDYRWFSMNALPDKLLEGPIHKAYRILFGDVDAQKTQGQD